MNILDLFGLPNRIFAMGDEPIATLEERRRIVLAACVTAESVQHPIRDAEAHFCTETVRAWARGDATIEDVEWASRMADGATCGSFIAAEAAVAVASLCERREEAQWNPFNRRACRRQRRETAIRAEVSDADRR